MSTNIKLIDKSALLSEIKRLRERTIDLYGYSQFDTAYENVLKTIDALEAKEVDLEEELKSLIEKEKAFVTDNREVKYYNGDSFNHIYELEFIAKHFFELGLKVQKGGEE